jgi:hypothetical protein
MKSLFVTLKSINHLTSFRTGDKVQIDECMFPDNKYLGFHGIIKNINLKKKFDNGFGLVELETKSGGELKLTGVLGKLKLKLK